MTLAPPRVAPWMDRAACITEDPELFCRVDSIDAATATCARCPVRDVCLTDALRDEQGLVARRRYGIRGGLTPAERWAISERRAYRGKGRSR